MTMSSPHARRLIATGFLFAAVGMLACEGDPPTSPDGVQIRAAKPPKDGGGDPTVISALPAAGEQGAVGLQIHVFGTGFEKGAKVAFHLNYVINPDPDPGMTVQSTKFVSSRELIATTDIALDAEVSSRDISVSFRGRRGIGTETFSVKVTGKPNEAKATFTLQPSLSDGLFQSGPFANEPLDEALIVDCDQGDDEVHTFVLERPADWGPLVPGDQIHCSSRDGFSRLDLNDMTSQICLLSDFPQGCQIGTDGHDDPDGFNFGPDLNYYFRVIPSGKKGGKGKFTSYNVVWIDARFTSAPPPPATGLFAAGTSGRPKPSSGCARAAIPMYPLMGCRPPP